MSSAPQFADVGKASKDHAEKIFPSESANHFETEINSKSSFGSKVQIVVKKGDTFSTVFKPTYPFALGDTKGELKFQIGTDNKTSIDTSFNLASIAGLKVKLGTNDTTINGGFEYANSSFSANAKVDYPVRSKSKEEKLFPKLDIASVFVHRNYALGAHVTHTLDGKAPSIEAKVNADLGNSAVSLFGVQSPKEVGFGFGYLHQVSAARTLAARISFVPGKASFADQVGVTLITSNQVNETTLLKTKYSSREHHLAFGVSSALDSSSNLELGAEFPANLVGAPIYNVKLTYNF